MGKQQHKNVFVVSARKAMWSPNEAWQRAGCSGPTSSKFHILETELLEPLRFGSALLRGDGRRGRSRWETAGQAGREEVMLREACVCAWSIPAPSFLGNMMAKGKLEGTTHQSHVLFFSCCCYSRRRFCFSPFLQLMSDFGLIIYLLKGWFQYSKQIS